MKICFFLQRRFAHIGHALALNLKKYHGYTDFCAYVSMRKSYEFLSAQKDITYTSLLLDEDVHMRMKDEPLDMEYLEKLEREYGMPNLWPYLYLDRIVMHGQLIREYPHDKPLYSHEEMLRLLQVTAKKIVAFLDREKPDSLIISVIGSLGSSLLYFIAKKRGIKVINIDIARIGNRTVLSEDYRTFSWTKKIFESLKKDKASPFEKEAREYLTKFREAPTPYHKQSLPESNQISRGSHLRFLRPLSLIKSLCWYSARCVSDLLTVKKRDFDEVRTWNLIFDKIKRKMRGLWGYNDLYSGMDNEPFAFYPLHYDPEIATMLLAPHYTNQIEVIQHAARSLPVGWKLYVKEHAGMVGYRPRAYYKEIIKIPNVKLIDPTVKGFELVKKSQLIITLTGTVGWEGVVYKKPVITFGEVFYNDLSFVKRARDYEELASVIQEHLTTFAHNEEELIQYIAALIEDSVPCDYLELWINAKTEEEIQNNPGIKALAGLLAKKIKDI